MLELWEERRILYEQCMDLQLFYRDTEHADALMTKQEVIIVYSLYRGLGVRILTACDVGSSFNSHL